MSKLKSQNQNSKIKTFKINKQEKKTIIVDKSGEYIIKLAGEGAEAQIVGAFVGLENEEFNIETIQHHLAPNTKSDLLIQTVLFKNSKLTYKGLIKIEKGADGSDAYQRNDNLLVGEQIKVESQPDLEIKANSVRCTHGVSTGRVSKEQMFYLLSRGLTKKEAEKIIIEGFFQNLYTKIKEEKEKRRLIEGVERKLKD